MLCNTLWNDINMTCDISDGGGEVWRGYLDRAAQRQVISRLAGVAVAQVEYYVVQGASRMSGVYLGEVAQHVGPYCAASISGCRRCALSECGQQYAVGVIVIDIIHGCGLCEYIKHKAAQGRAVAVAFHFVKVTATCVNEMAVA